MVGVEIVGRAFVRFDETVFSFCFSKMFFALGLFTTVFLPLASAAKALITQQRPTPAETFALLRQELDDEHLTDLVVTIAFYNGLVRLLETMQVDVEEDHLPYLEEFPLPKG